MSEAFYALQVAGQATSDLWPGINCFVDQPEKYEVTKEVLEAAATFVTNPAV